MELLQLRYFLEVARSQHVTKTAQRLHVSQPTVTQALKRLEAELGVALFDHVGRGIRLTQCGEGFLERIEPALALIDEAERSVRSFEEQDSRIIRMDVLAASSLAIDAVAAYSALHPEARFQISHTASEHDCDIVVRMPHRRQRKHAASASNPDNSSSTIRTFAERIMLAIPANAYPGRDELSLADVADEKFILLAGSKNLRDVCDGLCAHHGFSPTAVFESDNPSVVRKMIGLGLGVGFWPEKSWGACSQDGARLVALSEEGFERTIEISLEHNEDEGRKADFHAFMLSYFERAWKSDSCAIH